MKNTDSIPFLLYEITRIDIDYTKEWQHIFFVELKVLQKFERFFLENKEICNR